MNAAKLILDDKEYELPVIVGSEGEVLAPIEYVILRKLEYFRASGSDRHLRDVAMMLRISGDSVDQLELEAVCELTRRSGHSGAF